MKTAKKSRTPDYLLQLIVLTVIVVAFACFGYAKAAHETTHRHCTVTGKDRTATNRGSDMRVYTDRCGTFQVKDSIWKGGFNSADRFARIEQGKTYTLTATGWRVGFLSWFPNIITSAEEPR